MATLNLNSQQLTNAQIAIGAANAVYDLNRGGAYLRVGQPLVYATDLAGITPGYTALPGAPAGYKVTMVNNDAQSGLNLFVAYNASTNTAIVGIAGINGVLGGEAGAAADTVQIASGMKDQVAAMFKGSSPDYVNSTGLPILSYLNMLAGSNGSSLNVILGAQSGAGPAADALAAALNGGLTERAQVALDITDSRANGVAGLKASNIYVTKVNTLGSQYTLEPLGMEAQGNDVIANGATVTTIIAGDSSRNYTDPVPSYNGTQLGTTVKVDVVYPAGLPVSPGSLLGWFHRNEGALANYFAGGGSLNQLSTYAYNPLSMQSMSAVMSAFSGMHWDSNAASYGGMAAISLFSVAFSAPGASAETIGKTLAAVFGSYDSQGFFTAVGGVIEAAVKYGALTNPVGFITSLAVLLFGSKAANAMIGPDNATTMTQLQAWADGLPMAETGATRKVYNDPTFGPTAVDTYGDKTVFRQIDGTKQTVYDNGSSQTVFANGAVLMQGASGTGTLQIGTGGQTIVIPLGINEVVTYVPATDASGSPVSGPGTFKLSTYEQGQPVVERVVATDASWTQNVSVNGVLSTSTGTYLDATPTTNLYALATTPTSGAANPTTPDPTSSGPSGANNSLIVKPDYSVRVDYTLLGNVNTASGNAATANYFVSDGLRPGNGNLGINVYEATGLGLKAPAGNNAGLFGSSLNNAASSSFFLIPTDPLVLDLNGDGVRLTNYTDAPVLFDADNDGGSLEQTGWVSSADGILVHDLNGDGKINNIRETLSEYYNGVAGSAGVAGTKPYANGFAALKSLDSNADNQFTSADAAWSQLRVWVDANHDGKTDAGELKTFADLGITRINLVSTAQSGEVRDGNAVLARGSFTQTVGGVATTREAIAANFLANPAGSSITASGSGVIVTTESVATSAGTTSASSGFVSQNTNATVAETLVAATLGVKNLTGGAGNDTLTGDGQANWLAGGLGADKLYGGAGDDVLLIDANDTVVDGGAGLDVAQVIGGQLGSTGVTLNLASSNIEIAIGGDGNDVFIGGGRSTVFVRGGAGDDLMVGGAANDVLSGEDGSDTIDGGAGNDLIRGHRGQDTLLGGAGDDVLDGGLEDDRLNGGAGNDVLIGGRGDDTLDGGDGIDVAEYSGSYADYRVTQIDSTTWRVADARNGQDGADTLTGIEKLSFSDVSRLTLGVGSSSPLAMKDVLVADANNQAFNRTQARVINTSQLLANDRDWEGKVMRVYDLSAAQGGSISNVVKAADGVAITSFTFTPTAGYQGVMGFKYSVVDSDNITSQVTGPDGSVAAMRVGVVLRTPDLPTDPLVLEQWYLADANVLPVWQDYTGKGVHIGQFELGGAYATGPEVLDVTHPDLKANLDASWMGNPNNLLPQTYSNHATLVAGVMVAGRNGQGGVGVAYGATVAGYWLGNTGTVSNLAALAKMKDYDIANNSWGFANTFSSGPSTGGIQDQVDAAVKGRNGLGTVMVFGAGNNRAGGGNANYSYFSNSRYGIAVGAISATPDVGALQFGQAPFSNPGANILVSAPGANVTSTSRLVAADNGSVFGSDYQTVQGTSLATPIVSGIVALMLEANPKLGYRDVQEILALSSKKVSDPNTVWQNNHAGNWNGGAMHVSHDYGFGEVDAKAAVRLAETWQLQQTDANEVASNLLVSGNVNMAVPDNNAVGVTSSITVSNVPMKVEHAEVTVNLTHANAGDVVVKLISPTGTESILLNRTGKAPGSDATNKGDASFGGSSTLNFTFDTVRDWGEGANGTWSLQVTDMATGATGVLNSWSLQLFGADDSSHNDQYVYTNEYAGTLATDAARGTLNDTDGGMDTVNAAAINGAVSINLSTGAANLNGAALTIGSPANIENAIGGEYNDTLIGNSAGNRLFGGRGNDVLDAGAGNDIIDGGQGADVLTGGAGNDYFVVRAGDSSIDTVTDFVVGTDRLVLMGMDGVTASFVQQSADTRVDLSNGQSVLLKNVSAGSFTGVAGFGSVVHVAAMPTANLYQNTVFGSDANDTLYGTTSGDRMYGGNGDDILVGDPTNTGPGGGDVIDGGAGNDELIGGAGDDVLIGGAGADYVQGDVGNDTIYLEGDSLFDLNVTNTNASVRGNGGSDRFVLQQASSGDIFQNFVWDFELGQVGSPVDKIDLSGVAQATSLAQLDITSGNLDVGLGTVITEVRVIGDPLGRIVTLNNVSANQLRAEHFVFASAQPAAINPAITGTAGADNLVGDAGANTLNGLAGADSMTGRTGDDTYVVDNAGDTVNELPGGGYDSVLASVDYTLGSDVEVLTLTGAAHLNATGNAQRNRLVGNAGNNRLDGKAEADDMLGGAGNDTYVVDNQLDTATENAAEGTDTVESSVSWTLGNNFENLILTGTGNTNATGNDLGNTLTGNASDNILDGAQGADTLAGGLGNDTYYVDSTGDTVTEALDAGIDTVYSSINLALAANVENAVLFGAATTLTGNALDNTLVGNGLANTLVGGAGNDVLDGGVGADSMAGGAGDDTYFVDNAGDIVTELAGEGVDTVVSALAISLGANVENLVLTGTGNVAGTGNALNNQIGGNSGNNTLSGGAGNDTLDGGAGADTLLGGAGDDRYYVDQVGDVVTEAAAEGADTIMSAISYTLGVNVENLTLTGYGSTAGTGNSLNNVLTGNSLNNTLDGGAGTDTMAGGAGNDTYVVDNVADLVTENLNEGTDLVQSSVTYSLAANVENLTLTGTAATNATGNALSNVLTGNAAANVMNGGAGNDTMAGGAGNDTYVVDAISDVVTENVNEGTDLVQSSVTYALAANVENLTLTGTVAINATGNTLNNLLTGNTANNILDGGAGSDTMAGGAGNDIYVLDNATDVVAENVNEGTDLVQSSVSYVLGANVENLALTGTAATNGTGNALNNVLTGNTVANVLNGGAGNDTMAGGTGNDTYVVDAVGDVVTENLNEGTDLVQSSVTYTLGAYLENLTLTGTATVNATGNALNNVLTGNSSDNNLVGGAGDDIFMVNGSNGGSDAFEGDAGFNTIQGGAGDDTIGVSQYRGVWTVEKIDGGLGTNVFAGNANANTIDLSSTQVVNIARIEGGGGDDSITGSTGNDTILGGEGNDRIDGWVGNDTLIGGAGDDTFLVNGSNGGSDAFEGDAGFNTIQGGASDDTIGVSQYRGVWTVEKIDGGLGTNVLAGNGDTNIIDLSSTQVVNINRIEGGGAHDSITGSSGNDTIVGGTGDDDLDGWKGNDTYRFGRGDGWDTILENDTTAGNTDVAQFGAGITTDQLWFRHVGNDLEVNIIGTGDGFSMRNWYLGSQYHVEQFKTMDGKTLLDSQVQNLVQAMAAFAPPAAGQTTLASNYATALAPVLAANWQ